VVLVDTSLWVEVFRKNPRVDLERLTDFDEIATCLPVIQEVLEGFREERVFQVARDAMYALPIVEAPLGVGTFNDAIGLARAARRAGLTIRSSVECLIAACALRHDLDVLHVGRDYELLSRVSPLRSRSVAIQGVPLIPAPAPGDRPRQA
jgi:predicted nucleic acid-binding protein